MKRKRGSYWTLTIIRSGKDEFSSELERARFAFGRYSWEISDPDIDATVVPSGLVEAVQKADLVEEALEVGFKVEMTTGKAGESWTKFSSIASIGGRESWHPLRGVYASENGGLMELIQILSCSNPIVEMPAHIWVRVRSLPDREVVWAIESELLSSSDTRQMSLDNWFDLPERQKTIDPGEIIPLPGPNTPTSGFFSSRGR